MSFNIALSGLQAANTYLSVTGNNISNASTTGFKMSRTEFADVYAATTLGSGANQVGSGVAVADVAQIFTEGNTTTTGRNLDLAIGGKGYFTLSDNGSTTYTRAGVFGLDEEGYIVANNGANLQGFSATSDGSIIQGVLSSLQITSTTQEPHQSTVVNQSFNVNAAEDVRLQIGNTTYSNAPAVAQPVAGLGGNGYTQGQVLLDGLPFQIPSADGLTAAQIAAEISARQGVSASAVSIVDLGIPAGVTQYTGADLVVNGIALIVGPATPGSTLEQQMVDEINSKLANVTATLEGGNVRITSSIGDNIRVDVSGGAQSIDVTGLTSAPNPATPVPVGTMNLGGANPNSSATVGGQVLITLEGDTTFAADPSVAPNSNVWDTFPLTPFTNNAFDPADQGTYNHSTSTTVYDSLGNPHIMTQFFVKEPESTFGPNVWSLYVQIDGRDVGDTDLTNPSAGASRARFFLSFNEDGSLNTNNSDDVIVTNWNPVDANGNPNGALGPIAAAAGGNALPLPEPPTSSNIYVNVTGSTQYGGAFSVGAISQNGYAAGQLTGLEVSDEGIVSARFNNGRSNILGQVVLASFTNDQGLKPVGDTAWAETFDSGTPVIGEPQTGSLGLINSGKLEESNVDLSAQLVELIIAQRNYQANAKTIETANTVTQTIINLR